MANQDTLTAPAQAPVDLSGFLAGMNNSQQPQQAPAPKQPDMPEENALPFGLSKAAVAGIRNGAAEMIRSVDDLHDYIYKSTGVPHSPLMDTLANALQSDYEPPTIPGKIVEGASQFGTSLYGVGELLKPLKFIKSLGSTDLAQQALSYTGTASKAALAAGAGFDPHQARLSNLLQDMGMDNSIVNTLAANPDDTNMDGRFKNMMEGAGLGLIADSALSGVKTVAKAAKDLSPDLAKTVSDYVYNSQTAQWLRQAKTDLVSSLFKTEDPVVQTRLAQMTQDGGSIDQTIHQASTAANSAKAGMNDAKAADPGIKVDIAGPEKQQFTFSPEQAAKAMSLMNKPGPLEEIINTSNMSTGFDAMRAINATAKVLQDSGKIDTGVQSWEKTGQLADILGTDKKTLFQNLQAIGGTTENVAAHLDAANSFMQSLAEKVSRMSSRTDLTPAEITDHVNTINLLANVTSQYKGITKNIARGLQSLQKNKLPMPDVGLLDVNDVLNTPEGRLRYTQMAKMIAAQGGNLADTAKLLSPTSKAWMAFNEFYLNNLLSSPKTAVVNTVTGAANNIFLPAEKALAGMFRGNMTEVRAAGAAYKGVFDGMLDAVRLFSKTADGYQFDPGPMWKALRSGQNILDNQNAFDHPQATIDTRFLFNTDPKDLKGVQRVAANVFNMFGKFIRLPSHAIAASDELLKNMGARSELTRQLYIDGAKQRLSGQQLSDFIRSGIDNPDPDKWKQAIQYARETSFTQDLPEGGIGRSIQQFVANHPAARLFIPFVRTPINIMKFTFQHTPGINLLVKESRQELKDDPAMFMAKMATGTAMYTAAYNLALNGKITGSGPKTGSDREAWLAAGNQPYSVKIGNGWYQYNRLDPYGSFFGMTADAMDLLAKAPTRDADELATIMMASLARNVTSKTFLKGLSDAITAVSDGDPKKWSQVAANLASGMIPYSSGMNAVNQSMIDNHLHETFDLMDKLKAKIPGLSQSMPPLRNVWGDPVDVPEAVGPDLLSPLYAKYPTGDYKEKVAQEITRLGVEFGKPDKYVGDPANRFEFSPEQYDRLITLMGRDIAIKGKNLPETLQQLMDSPIYKNKMTDGDASFEGTRASAIHRVRQAFLQTAHAELAKEYPDYANYRQRTLMMKAATRRAGGDAILQQLSLPAQ